MRDLIRSLIESLRRDEPCLACQLVETKGSTPQKAGAWMLVSPDGGQVGTLGGGCVEAEVKQRSIERFSAAGAAQYTFVLDHDYAWADGLICGGKMSILAECFRGPDAAAYFGSFSRLLDSGEGFTEAVVVDAARSGADRLGGRYLFDAAGQIAATWPEGLVSDAGVAAPQPLSQRPRPSVRDGMAWLPSLPRIRLVIVGAGHVGQAVAELAARADFDVWVIDDRRQYANPERFPAAEKILVGPIESTLSDLEVDERTFALIVTRGHGHDQEALQHLAPTAAAYVGLIGSRRKIRLIFDALLEEGIEPEKLARVAAPVGLEIGSESVPEVAISIVAELIACRNLGPSALQERGWFQPVVAAARGRAR